MQTIWTYEHGRLCAILPDGSRLATWEAASTFGVFVDLLNASPPLSELLMAAWQGKL
ncbi:MAG: hypothetical protein K2Q97_15360 [Burkholderiaceae bacterium]|nr:hypothetical protein [Burkholderiaceae bacterium]